MVVIRTLSTCINAAKRYTAYITVRSMSNSTVNVKFHWGLTARDPEQQPVLIVGQPSHLEALTWNDVRCKLEPRVSEEAWRRGLTCARASPGDTVELWPRAVALGALPARRARHAAPSRAHALASLVRATRKGKDECVVLVCRKRDVYASAVAIARSYPLYSAKSGAEPLNAGAPTGVGTGGGTGAAKTVTVEVQLVDESGPEGYEEDEGCGPVEPYLVDGVLSESDLAAIQSAADATRLAARITDTPTNYMNVDHFIEEAIKVGKELNIVPTIIRGEELRERGMGGIYGVGRAAEAPPALVALSTAPAGGVAWVGKGIVYDTGGLSIKSRTGMVGMKGDCGGAAGVLGAFLAAARMKPSTPLHAVLCLAENSVGPKATRPDDIHTLYSGRTVEINNTDAEGRLVLSDGVVYANRDLKAEIIVDVATLTGAQGIATGKYHAGLVSNSGRLEAAALRAALRSADLAHALPFAPELHASEFASQVADMKNSVADRGNAQPSCAGLFILAHLGLQHAKPWLHVDMAAPAHQGERATGYGVALLTVLFGSHLQNPLLRALSPGPLL